jgi:hypothetical protein
MSYNEVLQKIFRKYEAAGNPTPAPMHDVAAWAIRQKLWEPRHIDIVDVLADDLSKALREEYRTDRRGRRYRVNHAVRLTRSGVQLTLWADISQAPRQHMQMAYQQRRQNIVGDCVQLRIDVDAYNEQHSDEPPLQLVLDFTQDVAEQLAGDGKDAA